MFNRWYHFCMVKRVTNVRFELFLLLRVWVGWSGGVQQEYLWGDHLSLAATQKMSLKRWFFVLTRENVNRHVSTLQSKQNPSAHAVDTMATSNPNIKHLFLWFHLHFRIKHFLVSTVKTISSSESDISNSKVNKKAAMWISERSLLRVALPSAFGRREILLKIAELNTQISRFQAHNFYNLITAREMN